MSIDLLQLVENGGCSSKIPPRQLEEFLKYLPVPDDPDILVNIDTHDDAGVYRVNDELALVFTTDFFPPVCSDPFEFGQVAATNSVSDVYAMGGTPMIALNLMMFPSSKLPIEACAEILKGGAAVAEEAGFRIIGGHTIDDSPPKYGLAVVGYVNPGRIITNAGARPGDLLILTKPLGTGILLAGQKLGLTSPADTDEAIKVMKQLNRSGAGIMKAHNIKGGTDVTGFGLAGHALKMARASKVSITIRMNEVPLIGDTYRLADNGCIPAAAFRNLEFADQDAYFSPELDYNLKMIAFDAQTSGGLLFCAPAQLGERIIEDLGNAGLPVSSVIGEVKEFDSKYLNLV